MTVTTADAPTRADIPIWRGDNAPSVVWQFSNIELSGSSFDLTVFYGTAELFAVSTDDPSLVLDTDALTVTWTPLSAHSALIPPGPASEYKLRRVMIDNRQTVAFGYFIGQGGNNADV